MPVVAVIKVDPCYIEMEEERHATLAAVACKVNRGQADVKTMSNNVPRDKKENGRRRRRGDTGGGGGEQEENKWRVSCTFSSGLCGCFAFPSNLLTAINHLSQGRRFGQVDLASTSPKRWSSSVEFKMERGICHYQLCSIYFCQSENSK